MVNTSDLSSFQRKEGNHGFDEATDIGTIISEAQLNKVRAYIEQGRQTPGATAYECGQLLQYDRLARGFFIRPVIFTGIDNTNPVAREARDRINAMHIRNMLPQAKSPADLVLHEVSPAHRNEKRI